MWGLTCHPWGRVELERDTITFCVHIKLCSYWGSWHAPSLCLLTNYFALLFPLLFTAFEAKPGHVAHIWMWDLTCHSWGTVDLEMDMGISLFVHTNFHSCWGSETGGGLWNACWCTSLYLGDMNREVMAGCQLTTLDSCFWMRMLLTDNWSRVLGMNQVICLLTNYLVPLFPVLPIAFALKHILTAFEDYEAHFAKPDYVAYTWMWSLTCHP